MSLSVREDPVSLTQAPRISTRSSTTSGRNYRFRQFGFNLIKNNAYATQCILPVWDLCIQQRICQTVDYTKTHVTSDFRREGSPPLSLVRLEMHPGPLRVEWAARGAFRAPTAQSVPSLDGACCRESNDGLYFPFRALCGVLGRDRRAASRQRKDKNAPLLWSLA